MCKIWKCEGMTQCWRSPAYLTIVLLTMNAALNPSRKAYPKSIHETLDSEAVARRGLQTCPWAGKRFRSGKF